MKKLPTERQKAACTRNWKLRQLRAYFHLCPCHMTPLAKESIQQLVDDEIIRLGGESEIKRVEERANAD